MSERTENVYVLYGSQTGNSEQAAKDMCAQFDTRLSPAVIQKITGTKDIITVMPTHMQLDDFLELERAKWTRLVVIFTSSYGVGGPPLGCYRFRELCDAWLEQYKETKENPPKILDVVYFAFCGLGDSNYTTFFQNPKTIDEAMRLVGAKRVGDLGKCDARGTGDDTQSKVIERWIDGIWPHLAQVVAKEPLSDDRLEKMQSKTVELCRKINPDFLPEKQGPQLMALLAVLVAVLAIIGFFVMQKSG